MLNYFKNAAAVALVTVFSTAAFAQTADEVINKHIAACGGKEKILAMNSIRMEGVIKQMGVEIPITTIVKRPNAMYTEVTFNGMKQIMAFDGKEGYTINPFAGVKEPEKMNEEAVKQAKKQGEIEGKLVNYKEKGSKAEFIGKEDLEGSEVNKIKLTEKDGDVSYYYIGTDDNMIIKESNKVKFQDKEMESDTYFSDYREVNGYKFPFSMEQRTGGQTEWVMVLIKIDANPKVEESLFKTPKK